MVRNRSWIENYFRPGQAAGARASGNHWSKQISTEILPNLVSKLCSLHCLPGNIQFHKNPGREGCGFYDKCPKPCRLYYIQPRCYSICRFLLFQIVEQ